MDGQFFDHIIWIICATKSSHGAAFLIDSLSDHPFELDRKCFFNLHKLWFKMKLLQRNYMKRLKLDQSIVQPYVHCFYFFGKCVKQERLILPLNNSSSHRVYIQLVPPSLLLIPVVGSAGQSPPAEPESMKPPSHPPSMSSLIAQVVEPVRTVRYLTSLEEVFCRTCNQLTPLTK